MFIAVFNLFYAFSGFLPYPPLCQPQQLTLGPCKIELILSSWELFIYLLTYFFAFRLQALKMVFSRSASFPSTLELQVKFQAMLTAQLG